MIVASAILLIYDPKFGAFVCLLALLSGLIQWKHQKDKTNEKEKNSSKKKATSHKKSTRPRKKH